MTYDAGVTKKKYAKYSTDDAQKALSEIKTAIEEIRRNPKKPIRPIQG